MPDPIPGQTPEEEISHESFDMESEIRFNDACIEEAQAIGRQLEQFRTELQQFEEARKEVVQPTTEVAEDLFLSLKPVRQNLLLAQRSFEDIINKTKV